ncbi:UTP--glucose-1-phosphate uridylyltransferase 3 [Ranunculus cassubicifolius]
MARTTPILHPHLLLPPSLPLATSLQFFKSPLSHFSPSLSSLNNGVSTTTTTTTAVRVSIAEVEYAPIPEFDINREISRLQTLLTKLSNSSDLQQKLKLIGNESSVKKFFAKSRVLRLVKLEAYELYLLKSLVAAGQEHVLNSEFEFESKKGNLRSVFYGLADMIENWDRIGSEEKDDDEVVKPLRKLLRILRDVEQFYDCIGGIIGYQVKVLELLSSSESESQNSNWSMHLEESLKCEILNIHNPNVLDLSENTDYASQAALWGIEGLPELGEIYPLGGSGDRLGLVDPKTNECLPAAMLPYCGRTLLEGLIRDLQAREYLYFKIYGSQSITPVAIMTSSAKNNHERITSLCEELSWFGRGRSNFKLFEQPLVPAVSAEDGQWLVSKQFTPVCKPGGHGAIWKLAYDKSVFEWFYAHKRKGATVRQVSNVVAATDLTLLALAGIGLRNRKKLGFASCKRKTGATEGINVLIEKKNLDGKWDYGLSCIEYTEFDKFGISNEPIYRSLQAEFPANTNILYIDLASAEKVGSSKSVTCLPGMVLNVKKPIVYVDHLGIRRSVCGGRLECTMQNIADNFLNTYSSRHYSIEEDTLDTYIVYNKRRKVTSSAKRKRTLSDKSLRQSPEGSLLDILRNASDLLSLCDITIPKIEDNESYFDSSPPFLILLHPALGPLWDVTRQKFNGGSISKGSELQIEVAELLWRNVELDGSMVVLAENIMGSTMTDENDEPILRYGHRCGRCKLQNVKVLNKGINWNYAENSYWKHDVQRFEALKIVLHGNAEFEASDVILQGSHVFEVPDGHKLLVTGGNQGLSMKLNPIAEEMMDSGSWFWKYKLKDTHIHLEMVEL